MALSYGREERVLDNVDLFLNKSCMKALLKAGKSGRYKLARPKAPLLRATDMFLSCSFFTINFYSPGVDYGLDRTFGIEKTVIIENKFTISFIEIPGNTGMRKMFSLFINLLSIPKSFKTIATIIFAILSPPCRVCEESDPPVT